MFMELSHENTTGFIALFIGNSYLMGYDEDPRLIAILKIKMS